MAIVLRPQICDVISPYVFISGYRRIAVKFGMMTLFDPLKRSDEQKIRQRTADARTCLQSIYLKRLSRGQNRYGADVDGGWRHLVNTIEPSVCGGDVALCQITLITCYYCS